MQSIRFKFLTLAALIGSGLLTVAAAQSSSNTSDWETLRPDGEEFSVQMPKGSTFETSKEPYHKMEINTRMYISRTDAGPVFGIVSLSGIKSNPALYTEMQRVNSYVDAFKQLFPPKLKIKDATVRLTLVGDKKLQGHLGREYRMTIGALSGTANVYATRKRFYAIVFLDSKKDEKLREQFIGSFSLPEKFETPVVAAETTPEVTPKVTTKEPDLAANPPAEKTEDASGGASGGGSNSAQSQVPGDQKKRAISGGILNGKALSLPKPEYPYEARNAGASGTVTVQVTIDEMGTVIAANAVAGHPLLQPAAVFAARQARFSPTTLLGEPVKVTGIITYNFVLPQN